MAKKTKTIIEDYRSMGDDALAANIGEEELRLKKTRFSHAVNPIENPLVIRAMRRTVARLKTEQRRRALGF